MPSNISRRIKILLWPIENKELRFFIPMAAMMMFALYNFASLRAIKDSLIVPNIGAESISFLKLWFVFPSAIIFTVLYLKLCNIFSIDKVFYIVTTCFLAFFIIFSLWLYPNKDYIHLDKLQVQYFTNSYPHFKWFIRIIGHWSFALMYIFSELWSVVIINLMFWQFANHVVDTKNAKRFYPLFGLIGNFGLVLAGNAMIYFSNIEGVPKKVILLANYKGALDTDISLKLSIFSVVLSGVIMILIMYYLNKYILKDKELHLKNTKNSITKLSLKNSIKLILNSKYIGMITIVIVCYGLAINVVEGPWKSKIQELYPSQKEYLGFMGHFNIWMGISCIGFMFIGSNIIRLLPWRASALFTPIIVGITGIAFFSFVVYSNQSSYDYIWFNPVLAAVIAGATQNIMSKASKYSLFDSTKEIAYIPLDIELRTKGKAAAEVVGAKLGKSMGAVIQSSLFTIMPTTNFNEVTPILMTIFSIVILVWITDIFHLAKEYNKINPEK